MKQQLNFTMVEFMLHFMKVFIVDLMLKFTMVHIVMDATKISI